MFLALDSASSFAGDFLPTHDATTNVLLPGRILASQTVTFTPEDYPFMFQWKLLVPGIDAIVKKIPGFNVTGAYAALLQDAFTVRAFTCLLHLDGPGSCHH